MASRSACSSECKVGPTTSTLSGSIVNERTSTSGSLAEAAPRGLALLVAVFALVMSMLGAVGGCSETPVDGSTADTTLRSRLVDTTVISERRSKADTIFESDHLVVVDTVFREIVVRDTVRLFDTIVVRSNRAREQVRDAAIVLWNFKTNRLDTVNVEFQPSLFQVTQASPEWRLKFEVTFHLARILTEERFGKHGYSALTIHIPDAPFRPGSLQLKDNPDFGMGAKLIWMDRVLRTGSDGSSGRNYGDFQVRDIDVEQRTFNVEYTGGFYPALQSPPIWIRVRFRMTY